MSKNLTWSKLFRIDVIQSKSDRLLRSGYLKPLREAVRSSEFYRSQLYTPDAVPSIVTGIFKLKIPNPSGYVGANGAMYSYNQCLAYTYWLTGDDTMLDPIKWVVKAQETYCEPTRWAPALAGWTERHTAFRLLSNVIAYEVTGETYYKDNVISQSGDFIWHQNGAGGQAPTHGVDGGLYHYGSQHGDGVAGNFIASPWMSVLTLDAMLRVYGLGQEEDVADFIRRMGIFLQSSCKSDIFHYYTSSSLLYPDYVTTFDGTTDVSGGRGSSSEHSLEVAAGVAWAWYFSELLNKSDPSLKNTADSLYLTYGHGSDYWLRPSGPDFGKPAYRIAPWRKYSWEHLPSGSLAWAMDQSGAISEPVSPSAEAGSNQTVINGSLVTLDGSASFDPNGDSITYSWVQTSGLPVSLSNPNISNPTFTALANTSWTFELSVTSNGQTTQDSVVITATSAEKVLLFSEPVHAWLFEEATGDIAIDSVNADYSGIFDPSPSDPTRILNGKVGGALSFDGANDRVEMPDFDFYGDSFTLSLWMNLDSQSAGCLVSKSDDQWKPIVRLSTLSSRRLDIALKTSASSSSVILTSGMNSFELNTWHHVTVIYNGTTLRILVDGSQVAETSVSGDVTSSLAKFALGNRTTAEGSLPISGMLDQVRIYDRALTAGEITILRDESPVSQPSTYASWLANNKPSLTGDDTLPDADPDKNGVSNLLEYALDFDFPVPSLISQMPIIGIEGSAPNQWATFTWRKNNAATDLTYTVEYSDTLLLWTAVTIDGINTVENIISSDIDGDSSASLIETRSKISTGERFFRLNVKMIDSE